MATAFIVHGIEIETALEETKKVVNENDPAVINAAIDRLTAAGHKLAEAMYKATPPPGAAPSGDGGAGPSDGQTGGGKKDDVVDAEFVDVDDKK